MAPAVGPVVGGWMTEAWSWPWLFLINVAPGFSPRPPHVACCRARPRSPTWRPSMLFRFADGRALESLELSLKQATA